MEKIYDYDTGKLVGVYRDKAVFDMVIRPRITQVYGDSGTGKTMFVDFIRLEKKWITENVAIGNTADNIEVFDYDLSIEALSNVNGCLIVIDKADIMLTDDIVKYILLDKNNHYLIYSRVALPLNLSPNYYGRFVKLDKTVTIDYSFSVKGWF